MVKTSGKHVSRGLARVGFVLRNLLAVQTDSGLNGSICIYNDYTDWPHNGSHGGDGV